MSTVIKERSLQTQLKYFECLFDKDHVCQQLVNQEYGITKGSREFLGKKKEVEGYVSSDAGAIPQELHRMAKTNVEECGYNWIAPSFWQSMFGVISTKQ